MQRWQAAGRAEGLDQHWVIRLAGRRAGLGAYGRLVHVTVDDDADHEHRLARDAGPRGDDAEDAIAPPAQSTSRPERRSSAPGPGSNAESAGRARVGAVLGGPAGAAAEAASAGGPRG